MTASEPLHHDFYAIKNLVYNKCNLEVSDVEPETESQEYGACRYTLNGNKIMFRVSKITPKKTGQFVAIWKRSEKGITKPLDISDEFDFLVITVRNADQFGQFIFPKSVLLDKEVLTKNEREGKRGMRVYAPWDVVTSEQAKRSQSWQGKYFIGIKNDQSSELALIKKLFIKPA